MWVKLWELPCRMRTNNSSSAGGGLKTGRARRFAGGCGFAAEIVFWAGRSGVVVEPPWRPDRAPATGLGPVSSLVRGGTDRTGAGRGGDWSPANPAGTVSLAIADELGVAATFRPFAAGAV